MGWSPRLTRCQIARRFVTYRLLRITTSQTCGRVASHGSTIFVAVVYNLLVFIPHLWGQRSAVAVGSLLAVSVLFRIVVG